MFGVAESVVHVEPPQPASHGMFVGPVTYPTIAEVVLKRGADACLIRWEDERFEVPALVVEKVVDTTAVGDSFSAAYLASRLKGGSPQDAALAGHRLASRVIQVPGALIPRD